MCDKMNCVDSDIHFKPFGNRRRKCLNLLVFDINPKCRATYKNYAFAATTVCFYCTYLPIENTHRLHSSLHQTVAVIQ